MIAHLLKEIPLFANLTDKIIENLLDYSSNKTCLYKEKEFIAMQGDICRSLYILYKGKVSAQMENAEGKLLNLETLSAPTLLAPAFIYATENRFPVNIVAIGNCEVLVINKEDFIDFMHENPSVMKSFITDISDRCLFLSRKLNEFALQNLRSRILNYLKKHQSIKNQQAVASTLGVARPSLIKVLNDLIEENILIKTRGEIKLKD